MRYIRCCLKAIKILKVQTLSTETVKGDLPHRDLHPAGHMTACSEETTKHRSGAFTKANTETGVSRDVAPAHIRTNVSEGTGAFIFRAICRGADVSEEPAASIFKVERHRYKRFGATCSSQFSTLMEAACCSENVVKHLPEYRVSLRGRFRGELSYLAPLGSEKISAPYFKQCFFRGGDITPQTESNTTPPSPKTEITNILFYILNLWLRIYCSGLRGCDTRGKEIVI